MSFCQEHWDKLADAIRARGLGHLIADNGVVAAKQFKDQMDRAKAGESELTLANYDPLMAAHWAIFSNVVRTLGDNAGYVLRDGPEDPIDFNHYSRRARSGRTTWPHCPLCYLGLAHELTCRDRRCKLPRVNGYDFYIGLAADDQVNTAAGLTREPG